MSRASRASQGPCIRLTVSCRRRVTGLAERVGGLEEELEWAHVLSLGEQQRIAFLRLLLHAPALAFLDEVRPPVLRALLLTWMLQCVHL